MPIVRRCYFIMAVAVLLSLSAVPQVRAATGGWQLMSAGRVYDMLKEGSNLWLIDVRGPVVFEEGHVEGSVNISTTELSVKRFPKQKLLVLVDDSLGLRNAKDAAAALLKNGQERVYVLDGGMTAWGKEGYPIAGRSPSEGILKVMVHELKWAVENKIPVKIYDLRDAAEIKDGTIQGSETVKGKELSDRLDGLEKLFKSSEKKGLAGKLEKTETVVLVLPLSIDVQRVWEERLRGFKADIRYLEGGYAAWVAKASKKETGACPVCPGKRKSTGQ